MHAVALDSFPSGIYRRIELWVVDELQDSTLLKGYVSVTSDCDWTGKVDTFPYHDISSLFQKSRKCCAVIGDSVTN